MITDGYSSLFIGWYTRFFRLLQSLTAVCYLMLYASLMLSSIGVSPVPAADLRYVKSPEVDLNVRRGPGTEHAVLTQLPHGTPLFIQERVGLWLRVVAPDRGIEGWVLQRYLSAEPPGNPAELAVFDPAEEHERFDRLLRQDVIQVQSDASRSALHISINGLIWQRLTPHQQANFLQRAHRLYNLNTVEIHDRRNQSMLSRLVATGADSFHFELSKASPN
jgi:hypothetical protein